MSHFEREVVGQYSTSGWFLVDTNLTGQIAVEVRVKAFNGELFNPFSLEQRLGLQCGVTTTKYVDVVQ